MNARPEPADLALSGGGVLGIGHAGAVAVLDERSYRSVRIAGTSAGSILAALLAAGKSVITTAVVGRDQGYLAQPWVRDRSIEVDGLGLDPFDFTISQEAVDRLYQSGREAATAFLAARTAAGRR